MIKGLIQPAYTFADNENRLGPRHIHIPDPPIGNKVHLIMERGMWVLERGPCVWLGMSITHAGSGGVTVHDGIPDHDGFFAPEPQPPQLFMWDGRESVLIDHKKWKRGVGMPAGVRILNNDGEALDLDEVDNLYIEHAKALGSHNGRRVSHAHPASLGMHIFSAGLRHGLTVVAQGEMQSACTMMTFTWMVPKQRNA